jgi:acyl carrier protein
MVPSVLIELIELPLTPNGKTDRRALARMAENDRNATALMSPKTATEKMLAEIWSGLLKVDNIGCEHDFFELGGHSLFAVKLILKIEEATDKRLSVLHVLENSRLTDLANLIDRHVTAGQIHKEHGLEP